MVTRPESRKLFLLFGLLGLAIAAAVLMVQSTPYGLGLVNDSAAYIGGAMNLSEGKGYTRVSGGGEIKSITHFPPLYSILMAGIGWSGIDPFLAARILNTFFFGLSVFLVGLSVYKVSGSFFFSLLGSFLLAFSDVHLEIYAVALSEPLFLCLMLAAYLLLAQYFAQIQRSWLVLAGVALGLAYLTRYAAISLWITALLSIFLLGYKSNRASQKTSLRPFLVLLGSGLPLVLSWLILETILSDGVGNRQIAWHPIPLNDLFEAMKNLLTWLAPDDLLQLGPLPGRLLSALSLLLLPGIAVWLIWRYRIWRSERDPSRFPLAFILGLHILVYMAFLVFSISFLDASIPLDDRILSVIYLPGIVLFTSWLKWLWSALHESTPVLGGVVLVISVILMAFSLSDGLDSVAYLSREGVGFTNRGWRESPALQVIAEMPPNKVLYSDRPTAIFLLTGRSAYTIPTFIDPVTASPRTDYERDLDKMHQAIKSGNAALVLFDLDDSRENPDIRLVEDLTGNLTLQHDFGTVTIYGK